MKKWGYGNQKLNGLVKFDWGLVISRYQNIYKKLLTILVVPSKSIFCASFTQNLWFVKLSFEMSSSNFL